MSPGQNPQHFLPPPLGHLGCKPSRMTEAFPKPEIVESTFKKNIPPRLSGESMENKFVDTIKRYVPPSLRGLSSQQKNFGLKSLEERDVEEQEKLSPRNSSTPNDAEAPLYLDLLNSVEDGDESFRCGGCADPRLVKGSIMDSGNIPRGASKVFRSPSEAFGSFGGKGMDEDGVEHTSWETGAASECGIRDSNEDAYLIVHDLREASISPNKKDRPNAEKNIFRDCMGLFAIFDGHCGNQAARFAAEKLIFFLQEQLHQHIANSKDAIEESQLAIFYRHIFESAMRDALKQIDDDFCRICQEGGRDWESGTTAIVAIIVDKWLIIANLGDCRGIVCRSVSAGSSFRKEGWQELDTETRLPDMTADFKSGEEKRHCVWQEVATVHKPSDEKEKDRIERANGWVTTETEIPIGQRRRMDFLHEDVVGILRRCFSDRYGNSGSTIKESRATPQRILQISRVCGELSVSRALGDRDFKAAFHTKSGPTAGDTGGPTLWDCPLLLAYPNEHSGSFHGNLVDNSPDFQQIQIGEEGCSEEFILLASDGLWDVLDVDDAARVTRDLLFRREWTAKRTAARLAQLAVHLGSSDNITVIVIRVIDGH